MGAEGSSTCVSLSRGGLQIGLFAMTPDGVGLTVTVMKLVGNNKLMFTKVAMLGRPQEGGGYFGGGYYQSFSKGVCVCEGRRYFL